MTYKTLQHQAAMLEAKATRLYQQAEAEHKKVATKNIEAWLDYQFESSCSLTPEFALFSKIMKKELIRLMDGYNLISYSRGHFEFSAFFKNITTGKLVYISSDDVRYWQNDWYENLLIRTAEHEKDYTGGSNNSSTLPKLKINADKLTQ